jgi:type I restriction enzyme S subunit
MINFLKDRKAFYNSTIPLDWGSVELIQVAEKIMVGIASAATHAYRNVGIILFRNQNIKEGYLDDSDILFIDETYEKSHKNKRLKGGDILIARTGYPGTACLVPEKYFGSQSFTTLIVRPKHELINKEYLCLYINSEFGQGYFETNQIGGGQKNVNAGTLETMPIPLPPLPEQKAIARVLSTAVAAIHTTEKLIAQKELRKKWLMQQLLTGKKRLKGFGGEWKSEILGNVVNLQHGYQFRDEDFVEQGIPVIKIRNVIGYDIVLTDMTFVDESRLEEFKSVVIENGDLLMSLTGNIGRVVEVMGIDKPMFQNYRVGKFTPIDKQITKAFLKFVLSSDLLFKQFNGLANQSAQANFGKQDMDKLKLRFPISLEEQTAIAYVLQTVDKEIRLLKAKAEKLKEQKKGLMQQLLTGKVRLKIKE